MELTSARPEFYQRKSDITTAVYDNLIRTQNTFMRNILLFNLYTRLIHERPSE